MIPCPFCAHDNPPDATLCEACGRPLSADAETAVIPPPRLLAQIQGLIPAEPVITTPLALEGLPAISPALAGAEPARADSSASVPDEPVVLRPQFVQRSPRALRIIGLLFVLLAAVGLFVFPAPAGNPPRRPSVEMFYSYIEILPPGARVLLAWDYEPTTAGEMQLLSTPVLEHLRRKRALLANVSLKPTGPSVSADAYDALPELSTSSEPMPTLELGYLPGDTAALRALSNAPASAASLSRDELQAAGVHSMGSLDAFDLIIEFSADVGASQEWIEQVAVQENVPLLMGLSGAVGPALLPYEQTNQVRAMLIGYNDALAYERLLGRGGAASGQQQAQNLLHLGLVLLVLVALIRSLLGRGA